MTIANQIAVTSGLIMLAILMIAWADSASKFLPYRVKSFLGLFFVLCFIAMFAGLIASVWGF